jgi:hypothetical protein
MTVHFSNALVHLATVKRSALNARLSRKYLNRLTIIIYRV